VRAGFLLVAILCGAAARADDRDAGPPPADAQKKLSEQDAELVKDMALLERLDLLRNLDLFEEERDAGQSKQAQPQPPPGDG